MITLIKNGKVIDKDFKGFTERELWVEDGRITDAPTSNNDVNVVDAKGNYVLPGLIDIHNHGSKGIYYGTASDFKNALEYTVKAGVTSVLPSIGVLPLDEFLAAIKSIVNKKKSEALGIMIDGIHLEGPFISIEKKGAMRMPSIEATVENFNKMIDAGEGLVKIMTIAPERENAPEIIAEGKTRGIRMSVGHTMATYEETVRAIDAGASGATHTFNAMRSYNHRESGVLGAVLTDNRVTCETICDFVHLAEPTVRIINKCKGVDGMILISDAGAQTGMPDGEYVFGGTTKIVKNGVSTLPNGTIAGSTKPMSYGAQNLVKMGFSMNEVSKMGSYNPAKAIGMDNEIGSIESGKRANIIIVDEAFNVNSVFLDGSKIL